MSIPIVFTLVFTVLSLSDLFFKAEEEQTAEEEQAPKKTTEEALGEVIAKLLIEKKEASKTE